MIDWKSALTPDGTLEENFPPFVKTSKAEGDMAIEQGFRLTRFGRTNYAVWVGKVTRVRVPPPRIPFWKDESDVKGVLVETIEADFSSISAYASYITGKPVEITIEGDRDSKQGKIVVKVSGLSNCYRDYERFCRKIRKIRLDLLYGLGVKKGQDAEVFEIDRDKPRVKPQPIKAKTAKSKSTSAVISNVDDPAGEDVKAKTKREAREQRRQLAQAARQVEKEARKIDAYANQPVQTTAPDSPIQATQVESEPQPTVRRIIMADEMAFAITDEFKGRLNPTLFGFVRHPDGREFGLRRGRLMDWSSLSK